jgi:uncharacterized coiled-coil DUF342 family protein
MTTLSVQQKQTETDIAVLQVQYSNLTEKVDDLKTGLREMRDIINENNTSTQELLTRFQHENAVAHADTNKKITALEKWKWMIMGGGMLLGVVAEPMVFKVLGLIH